MQDEAQLSLLSTCGDISVTGCDNQAKQLSAAHVYVMDDSRSLLSFILLIC